MRLTPEDIVCCPPPLFHTFGLVLGFLSAFTHGSTIVFPSDHFDADRVINAVIREKATALLGVPTMFVAELEICETRQIEITTVRTGLAAGSPVSETLLNRLKNRFGIRGMLIAYGMTETSPVTFMTSLDDPREKAMTSLGKVLPHTSAKIVDHDGAIVRRGEMGELCTSGYGLQKGYFNNDLKTREAMRRDVDGRLWMHTGDQCFLDPDGYCHISGRIKDIIIRGETLPSYPELSCSRLTDILKVVRTSIHSKSKSDCHFTRLSPRLVLWELLIKSTARWWDVS
jgi:acyl-CoA synthetase (AMP-forming)/AMP-acid ligase II